MDLDRPNKDWEVTLSLPACKQDGLAARRMEIKILPSFSTDTRTQTEMDTHMSVWRDSPSSQPERVTTFSVNPFDFPMIDNVRLPDATRVAVALTRVDDTSAEVTAIYFPGTRTSLKDRPYHDEVMQNLVRNTAMRKE